ncbi:MAG: exosortase family protein XrtF [Cyclobacteriaceae bacterium]|nr:exosortase family protein XrtF [Cyclobacteriaceae bacterium]
MSFSLLRTPAFRFVLTFLLSYVMANVVYGVYIEALGNEPDWFTTVVSQLTVVSLQSAGINAALAVNPHAPTWLLQIDNHTILSVYEGCNAVNVLIVLNAFFLAYTNTHPARWKWVVAGNVLVYGANIVRLLLLCWVAIHFKSYFYYVHKYAFTAAIYAVVFLVWFFWIRQSRKAPEAS